MAPRSREDVGFREIRRFRNGALLLPVLGCATLTVAAPSFGFPRLPLLVTTLAFGAVVALGHVVTVVSTEALEIRRRPGWSTRVRREDITSVRVEYDDGAWAIFGGWNDRHSPFAKEIRTVEGRNSSTGNRAVVVTSRDGREVWVGTFRPNALLAALGVEDRL